MKLDDLIRETREAKTPEPDWKAIDEKLFERLETEKSSAPADAPREEERGARVVWIGAALSLAAAAAALVFVHPAHDGVAVEHASSQSAGVVVAGDVTSGGAATKNLASGDRIDVVDSVAYFESKNAAGEMAVRWSSQGGSVLRVEHAVSPLVLSLEKGVAEAQVTPVPSGEAFAIDVTASSGDVVRVAVHGTHLRVARNGDKVAIDLTEGVVSIGAPPRRGSTIGTLITAPAHVELDARDLASLQVDHAPSAIRAAEAVSPVIASAQPIDLVGDARRVDSQGDALLPSPVSNDVRHAQSQTSRSTTTTNTSPNVAAPPAPQMLTTEDALAGAIAACGQDAVAPQTTFTTNLVLTVNDDGSVQNARFHPPLLPEARDCAANVIYHRTKLSGAGHVEVPITITR